ncbi:MAG TPA: DUF2752 domain-containing protein [Baekduia sp.]|nr:DUF2752 domain-containing protein [Baekduia sp.]
MLSEIDLRLGLPCPFRAATGLPCPLCGGTRAVDRALHLDSSFLDYGAVWVFVIVAALVALAGFAVLMLVDRRRATVLRSRVLALPARVVAPSVLTTVAVAWAWALAHASTIAP